MAPIDTSTRLCAVIGNPVAHSLSPALHNTAFEAAGLDYVYLAFRVEDVPGCLAGMRSLEGFRGMSVTIPHKMAVMPHLDEVVPMAVKVGSVNTITRDEGRLIGSTTDGPGALRAFDEAGVSLEGKRVLFVGSGGAVRAVAFAAADLAQPECITVLGRTPSRVEALVSRLVEHTTANVAGGHLATDLPAAMATHDVVIQGTPLGMVPHPDDTPVAGELFRPGQAVFDMVYRPLRTRFVREAQAAGCTVILGTEMLLNQAALQFEQWTGARAPRDVMRVALLRSGSRGGPRGNRSRGGY